MGASECQKILVGTSLCGLISSPEYNRVNPKAPISQEITCHFSQDDTMVTKILDFIHKHTKERVVQSFFISNLNDDCSQLSFKVYNACVAQTLKISEFLIDFCLDPGYFGDLPRLQFNWPNKPHDLELMDLQKLGEGGLVPHAPICSSNPLQEKCTCDSAARRLYFLNTILLNTLRPNIFLSCI